ncbi:flagellar basal-body MS-ring/collar protein FliF [Salinisphaera hydrothermalis]|uniref:Flagellar M-ring protein n=1 Tax=Salinisphaera hydrothermalis (strain C41B8) TaxID=1304275 RepID=A0A084IMS8_SALHC|nr:flagellar basal-body MS-ring/collar protein FliF [Salinisphaera hydrothermalis]KEZ78012.1 flagellar MS-ring protein [Salinisphaera hydrothermalis C41B8]
MSSAEAQASTSGGLADVMARLRASPRIALIIGVAAAVAVLVALLLWTRSPDYAVLYSGLSNRDGGEVTARLDQMQVPYKLSGGGSTIMVPRSRVDRIRLQMASDGLPKGGGVGFELMDNEPFGISEFAEKVNYQRALEGELERSIETIDEVSSARVQLAMPKSSVFVRDQKQPKASVVLELYSGRALAKGQVTAIQNLVASAVPGLPIDAVTIVDSRGHLLSGSDAGDGGVDGTRLAYAARVEKTYQQRIQNLLAPIVGADNVRTQVVADLDFAKRERTSENYSPNNGNKPAAIRSQQTSQKVDKNGNQGGVPGALSNQPTPNQPSPINNPKKAGGNNQNTRGANNNNNGNSNNGNGSLQTNGALGLDNSGQISTSKSDTTNYELDHTIAHVTDPVGQVQRVSVAVVINQKALAAGSGKNATAGLSKQQMDQIRSLVRGAIGYSATRGDSVEVMQMPFTAASGDQAPATPSWWQNPTLQSMAIKALKYLVLALVAWLLWRRLVRPLAERSGLFGEVVTSRRTASNAPPAAEADSEEDATEQALRSQRRKRHTDAIRNAQEAAREDPRMVAMIVKGWMKEDV